MLSPPMAICRGVWCFAAAWLLIEWNVMSVFAAPLDLTRFPGVVVDDSVAETTGTWKKSTSVRPYFGEGYIHAVGGESAAIRFSASLDEPGIYEVLVAYTASGNRPAAVPVIIETADGPETVSLNQQRTPQGAACFHHVGSYRFEAGPLTITIAAEQASGAVIADAVAVLTADEWKLAQEQFPMIGAVADKNQTPAAATPPPPPQTAPPLVKVVPSQTLNRLTPQQLDALLEQHLGGISSAPLLDDEGFLRRITLDLIGRPPTLNELDRFDSETAADKRDAVVRRLLSSSEFGVNWASYWSDVISYRTPQPELTFLNFQTLQDWLAAEFNAGATWDETVYRLLTATGKVGDNPAAAFIGFHQADRSRLAAETTRVFLATQIQCAECHDHKFIEMPRETFHHFAAFFVRTEAKLPWNDSDQIEVKAKDKGEHKMPGGRGEMQPVAFGAAEVELGKGDLDRRVELARWIVSPDNPYFAKAHVNRLWSRLMGRGFCEPVDEIGELADPVLPEVHAALGEHFAATGFDIKDTIGLIVATQAYSRALPNDIDPGTRPFAVAVTSKLRGDEVFNSLAVAIDLPNAIGEQGQATAAVRFPPPPKSTRDLVNEAFGFDPSVDRDSVLRSMKQAMFLMNNSQVQQQIKAEISGTLLNRLLAAEPDDRQAIETLFRRVLARRPTEQELTIAVEHLLAVGQRHEAFEDLLWSLVNSTEFTTAR